MPKYLGSGGIGGVGIMPGGPPGSGVSMRPTLKIKIRKPKKKDTGFEPGAVDFTQYTETVSSSDITVESDKVTATGLDRDDPWYLARHFGEYIGAFEMRFTGYIDSTSIDGGLMICIGLDNVIDYEASTVSDEGIKVGLYRVAAGSERVAAYNRTDNSFDIYYGTHSTLYYMKVTRTRTRFQVGVYSDSDFTTLLQTLSIDLTGSHRPNYWLCQYGANDGTTGDTFVGYMQDLEIISTQTFTKGWNPYESHVDAALDDTLAGTVIALSGDENEIATRGASSPTVIVVAQGCYIADIENDTTRKFYYELEANNLGSTDYIRVGIAGNKLNWTLNSHVQLGSQAGCYAVAHDGTAYGQAATVASYFGSALSDNDVIGVAVDLTNASTGGGKIWFSVNGTWGTNGGVGDPANGTNPAFSDLDLADAHNWVPACSIRYSNEQVTLIAESEDMSNMPTGFSPFVWMGDTTR